MIVSIESFHFIGHDDRPKGTQVEKKEAAVEKGHIEKAATEFSEAIIAGKICNLSDEIVLGAFIETCQIIW